MTHQEYRERLYEIYPFCNSTKPDPENTRKCYHCGEFLSNFYHTGKQAIDRLFLDVVGGDLPIGDEIAEGRSYTGERLHNKIKAQLRTTITGKEGGDE